MLKHSASLSNDFISSRLMEIRLFQSGRLSPRGPGSFRACPLTSCSGAFSEPPAHLHCLCLGVRLHWEPQATLHPNPSAHCVLRPGLVLVFTVTGMVPTRCLIGGARPTCSSVPAENQEGSAQHSPIPRGCSSCGGRGLLLTSLSWVWAQKFFLGLEGCRAGNAC